MGDGVTIQTKRGLLESGAMTPEEMGLKPTTPPPAYDSTSTSYKSGSSAKEDAAKAQGITVQELERRQRQQLEELLRNRNRKAGGGLIRSPLQMAGGGSVSGMARRMAQKAMSLAGDVAPEGALSVVKSKGGNWLNGSVEDALQGLKKGPIQDMAGNMWAHDVPKATEIERAAWAAGNPSSVALNNWIDKQLTRYVKNEMATPEDPIRALAEQGVLHYEPRVMGAADLHQVQGRRNRAGFYRAGEATSPLAEGWENASDDMIIPRAWNRLSSGDYDKNPWMEKFMLEKRTSPEIAAYDTYPGGFSNQLGFDHLIDELANATNPDSGLPRHLLLDPSSLPRVSVPQAVQRVHAINQWRAAQKAEADLQRANNAATVLHKDYPDKGFKWVELKAPKDSETYNVYDKAREIVIARGVSEEDPKFQNMVDEVAVELARPKNGVADLIVNDALRDALRYEGETMGHCVGGYCDDVISGRSRIFSLRDAKGQPHVTIETRPGVDERLGVKYGIPNWERELGSRQYNSRRAKELLGRFAESGGRMTETGSYADPTEYINFLRRELQASNPERYAELMPELPPALDRIVQIKGKSNLKPNDEYLPFVQDFVKSGKWGDVGDLRNTQMWKHPKTGEYFTHAEADADEALGAIRDSRNLDENGNYRGGYAEGGLVKPSEMSPLGRANDARMTREWDLNQAREWSRNRLAAQRKLNDMLENAPSFSEAYISSLPRPKPQTEMRESPMGLPYGSAKEALAHTLDPRLGLGQVIASPLMVTDVSEAILDKFRGVHSPSRFRQIANAISSAMGGPTEPEMRARGDYDNFAMAGSLLNPANFIPGSFLQKVGGLLSNPRAIKRLLGGHSLKSVTAAPATLREIKPLSDDYFNQLKDIQSAQERHGARLLSQGKGATPDLLSDFMERQLDPQTSLYEITSPARGWTMLDRSTGYVPGLLSEHPGGGLTNPTFNALLEANEGRKIHATAASDELKAHYKKQGIPVDEDYQMEFAEGGLVDPDYFEDLDRFLARQDGV